MLSVTADGPAPGNGGTTGRPVTDQGRTRDGPRTDRGDGARRTARILVAVWSPLAALVAVLSLALAAWAAWRAVRDRPVILRQLVAAGVVEALLLVQVVVAAVRAVAGDGPADAPTFWGYLLTTLVVLPVAAAWAFAERTRWSSVVLVVAAVTVAFLAYRCVQVWVGGA